MTDVNVTLSPEALEGLEALARMLADLSDVERAFVAGDIHGRRQAEQAQDTGPEHRDD